MAFHNYAGLVNMHKRPFQITQKQASYRDNDTTRLVDGGYGTPVDCEGVFDTITEKEYRRFPELEQVKSDLKVITTPALMNGVTPTVKDKIEYGDFVYYIVKIYNRAFYGNYLILYLSKEEYRL